MNRPETQTCLCSGCGAPLGLHRQQGLCSRCLARVALPEDKPAPVVESAPSAQSALPCRFGDYELLEPIAHGGMGVVYKARQLSLNRIVAVKMPLFGQFAGKAAYERFRTEAETAARLQHPNIVAIHAVGETEGQPYFSMDYVAGRSLAEIVRNHPLPARQTAGYLRTIARAVHYAHTQGVLHRDLKPANVLIDAHDEPRITDFGLARRLTDSQLSTLNSPLTVTGQVLGSPNFMPPEQGAAKKAKLGPTADVYGLGALLYYLITARPPFAAETLEATLAQVLNTEPVTPRQLNPGVPRDLETICLKCLEKDPGRRYASAQELAEELDRFLKGEPIRARPIGAFGKSWRWCRRKPAVAGMAGVVSILLLTVTFVSLTAARRTQEHARQLQLNLYVADMNLAYQAVQDSNLRRARELILKYMPRNEGPSRAAVRRTEDLRGWEWRYLWHLSLNDSLVSFHGHTGSVTCVAFLPNGRTLVTAGYDRTIRVWDVATRRMLHCLAGFQGILYRNSVALSPDGKLLAAADGTDLHIFETPNWTRLRSLPNQVFPGHLRSIPIAFSPDGKTLSCNAESEIRHWDTTSWERQPSHPTNMTNEFGRMLVYSRDGRQIVTAHDQGILFWQTHSNSVARGFSDSLGWPWAASFSPDGKMLAAVGNREPAIVWDLELGKQILRLPMGGEVNTSVVFSPDGRRIATADALLIRIWDRADGRLITVLRGAPAGISALCYSPDGQTLVSASGDGIARLWPAEPKEPPRTILNAGRLLCFSADGQEIILFSTNSCVEYWDLRSGNQLSSFRIPVDVEERDRVAASPDCKSVVHVSTRGIARIWDPVSGEQTAELALDPPPKMPLAVFSPDSSWLAVAGYSGAREQSAWTLVWNLRHRQRSTLPGIYVDRPLFSPDSRILVTSLREDLQVWSLPDLKPLARLKGHKAIINGLAFSRDGKLLASTGKDGDLRLWDIPEGRLHRLCVANPYPGGLSHGAFSPDGKTLVAAWWQTADFWNVASGTVALSMKGRHFGEKMFAPDGNTLVIGGRVGIATTEPIELLRAPSLEEIDAAENAQQQSP